MAAEYAQLKDSTNHDVVPVAGQSLPNQAIDSAKDTREIHIHPNDPKKITFGATNLNST
jgi:hypothetical protein